MHETKTVREAKAHADVSFFTMVYAHIYKQYKIMLRSPSELAWLFVYPFIGLLSTGLFATYVTAAGGPPESILFVLVGVIAWNFYDLSQRSITYAITFDIWDDCLKHGMVTSSGIKEFIIGNSIFGLASSVLGFLLVGAVGIAVFGFNVFASGIILILALIPVFIFATAVGLLIDALMVMKGHNWMSLIWSISGVIMIFSGVYYPVSVLPEAVQSISYILPTTYAVDAVRSSLGFAGMQITESIIYAFLLSFVYVLLCAFVFRTALHRSKKTGKLAQY